MPQGTNRSSNLKRGVRRVALGIALGAAVAGSLRAREHHKYYSTPQGMIAEQMIKTFRPKTAAEKQFVFLRANKLAELHETGRIDYEIRRSAWEYADKFGVESLARMQKEMRLEVYTRNGIDSARQAELFDAFVTNYQRAKEEAQKGKIRKGPRKTGNDSSG